MVQSEIANHKIGTTCLKSLSAPGPEQHSIHTPQQPGCFWLQTVKGLGRQRWVRIWGLCAKSLFWALNTSVGLGSPNKKPHPTPLLPVHVCPALVQALRPRFSPHQEMHPLPVVLCKEPSAPLLLPDTEGTSYLCGCGMRLLVE